MALFDKIFSTKRKLEYVDRDSRNWARSSEITPEQVRLLLFKECDWRGRKVLFDSSTIERVPVIKNEKPDLQTKDQLPYIVEMSNGFCYMYKGPAADANVLGDMIFGAVSMNYRSVSLKIHIMNEPKRFMCTKVFCVPTSRRISRVERSKTSEANNDQNNRNESKPLNVPALREEGVSLSFSIDRGDSGFYGEQSPYSSVGSSFDYYSMLDDWDGSSTQDELSFQLPPGRKLSISSRGSWQRRTFQSLATRFELGQSSNLLNVPTSTSTVGSSDSQLYSNSTTSGTSDSLLSTCSAVAPRRNKLGLALLVTVPDSTDMNFIRRCVEHNPQLQALVCRLRLATLAAGSGGNFVSTLYKAGADAARWLSDLIYGPRLQSAWLSLVTSDPRSSNKQSESLLSDLCAVLAAGDTKHTNFFISTLLTNVLTHHLGWVTTVSPYDTIDPQMQAKPAEYRRPYNALWAQLGDLCGSIGFPPRSSRTIIVGATNTQFMKKLLAVLTYFIRCGDVTRTDFMYKECELQESKVTNVKAPQISGLSKTETYKNSLEQTRDTLKVPIVNTQSTDSSISTLVSSDVSLKRSTTLSNFNDKLSINSYLKDCSKKSTSQLRRNPTVLISLMASSDLSSNSSESEDVESEKVVFVLGDDEKLVGLKNKSNGGRSVKKSSKVHSEPVTVELPEKSAEVNKASCDQNKSCSSESPSKCCRQTLQHSKPIKHSGFKFEFDKYPQIVTNYMKSKNLEILDRHYIGKPGNLKLDNFQFDPTIVPPIQEERCEICYKCQLMESMLQTPTNASEMEYMNDMPRQSEPQFAKETIVSKSDVQEMSPKSFIRKRKENTIIINLIKDSDKNIAPAISIERNERVEQSQKDLKKPKDKVEVKQVIEFPLPSLSCQSNQGRMRSGFDASLLGGVTDHYIPDLILQGTIENPKSWEMKLKRDLDLASYLNKTLETPMQAVAIVGDTITWEVRVIGRDCGWGGLSPLVGGMLDALPIMRQAKVPTYQCVLYLEGKLRELCVLSKTLADLLMTTDFCDIATLTKSLNIDVNDVPLLLAVAMTHTPQLATRYGISYR